MSANQDNQNFFWPTSSLMELHEDLVSKVREYVLSRKKQDRRRKNEVVVSKLISDQLERQPNQVAQSCEPHGIQILPDDVLRDIIDKIENLKDLFSCELVCRRWSAITLDVWSSKRKLIWKRVFFGSRDVYSSQDSERRKLFSLLKKCPQLRELQIDSVFDDMAFFVMVNCCPEIEKLALPFAVLDGPSLKSLANYYPGLKELHLPSSENLKEEYLEIFLERAGRLEVLEIRHNNLITGECFDHLSRIRELDIRGCQRVTDRGLAQLAEKSSFSLEKLTVGSISKRTLVTICDLFPNLKSLSISYITKGTGFGDNSPIIFSRLRELESLEIWGCMSLFKLVGDEEFVQLIKPAKKLKRLSFPHSFLTDEAISVIPTLCKKIEYLDLKSNKITDRGLINFSGLHSLVKLSLRYNKVTDDGIMKILDGCPNLVSLDVHGCSSVSIRTLINAYDLVRAGLLNKQISIHFNNRWIRMVSVKTLEDLFDYDGPNKDDDDKYKF